MLVLILVQHNAASGPQNSVPRVRLSFPSEVNAQESQLSSNPVRKKAKPPIIFLISTCKTNLRQHARARCRSCFGEPLRLIAQIVRGHSRVAIILVLKGTSFFAVAELRHVDIRQ
jgi:hypothetical protein